MSAALTTVQSIYAAFGRGDIPAILDTVAPDVQWEAWADNRAQAADVPWMRAGTGPQAVAAYFGEVAKLTIHDFQVLSMMANETQAAVEFVIEFTTPAGARLRDEEVHLWTVNAAGKVTRLRHYLDTAKHIACVRAAAAT